MNDLQKSCSHKDCQIRELTEKETASRNKLLEVEAELARMKACAGEECKKCFDFQHKLEEVRTQ